MGSNNESYSSLLGLEEVVTLLVDDDDFIPEEEWDEFTNSIKKQEGMEVEQDLDGWLTSIYEDGYV